MAAYHSGKRKLAREVAAALCLNMTAWQGQPTKFVIADTHCPEATCPVDSHLATYRRCEWESVDAFIGRFAQSDLLGSGQNRII
jgi:hypothetical protein